MAFTYYLLFVLFTLCGCFYIVESTIVFLASFFRRFIQFRNFIYFRILELKLVVYRTSMPIIRCITMQYLLHKIINSSEST